MAKEVNLKSYWMPVLRKIREFTQIDKAETPELEYLLREIDRTLNNMFIESADEAGIKRFEDMMGIYPEIGATLEERRFNALIKWNDKVPYTKTELENRLETMCGGADKYKVYEDYKNYFVKIITKLGIAGAFDAVTGMLVDMLPANLVLELKNELEAVKTTPIYGGVVACTAFSYQITNDISPHYVGDAPMYYGIGLSEGESTLITHDISSKANTDLPLFGGTGVGIATTKLITNDINNKSTVAGGNGNYTMANPVNKAVVITLK